jgi:hypothetical protein
VADEATHIQGPVAARRHKSLVLILAREFASSLATPIYIADAEENLVYFNDLRRRSRRLRGDGEIPITVGGCSPVG